MSKIISTIIKASLVVAGLMGTVPVLGFDFDILPLAGHMLQGTPVYGPPGRGMNMYVTPERREVKKIVGQWLYVGENGIYLGETGEAFDVNGNPLQYVDTLADGCLVYEVSEDLKQHYCGGFAAPGETCFRLGSFGEGYIKVRRVKMLYNCYVYSNYKYCSFPRQAGDPQKNLDKTLFCRGAYFDGYVWIDRNTGETYSSLEKMPEGYELHCNL
ncbi:MAG: hypothetical protein LBJ78_01380 [Puniceicoccales bacterium]|nr:hypothetical protein [Puniceicoccales bacterium]